ncbi:MAG TPA: DnaJ domain-containing protein [Sphingomonas sp.]|nr:DnaJ domain-containing protein [Sphingomonas sp.]
MKWLLAVAAIWAIWLLLRKNTRVSRPRPDLAEARAVLGVAADADADSIRSAHRRLAAQVHPDRGGSADLAHRVNAARDLLLKSLGKR